LQEGEAEDQAGEDDVQTGWHFLGGCQLRSYLRRLPAHSPIACACYLRG
jgi:hypothetical protein